MLFVGESPPSSGRLFHHADSGFYRAIRQTFLSTFPDLKHADFRESFRRLNFYPVDLCGRPVDPLTGNSTGSRARRAKRDLGAIIRRVNPEVMVTVVSSIRANVQRAQARAKWQGADLELLYPGRWKTHRVAFERALRPVLGNLRWLDRMTSASVVPTL